MPRKMARQTLERHAGACYAGSRPYLGSGLLGSPENRYNLPHFPSSSRGIPAREFRVDEVAVLLHIERGGSLMVPVNDRKGHDHSISDKP
jgi:hypothetical protein